MNNASQGKQMQTFAFDFPRFVQKNRTCYGYFC